MKKCYLLLLLTVSIAFQSQSQVVINEIYGGGGNSGSNYRQDFIELYNNGTVAVNISGWSVQYASATGTTWQKTNLTGTIAPGGYYLIQQAQGAGGTTNIPAPDVTGTIPMSGTTGKVFLMNDQTLLTGSCPAGANVVDYVGFGTANCFETAVAPAPSNSNSIQRIFSGSTAQDTQNNNADFAAGTPSPVNGSGATDITPPAVTTLSPSNGAVNIPVAVTASVTFNEAINKGTGNILVKRSSDDVIIQTTDITSAAVTVSGSTATFDIAGLSFNTQYYIEIPSAGFKDLAGNNFAGITGNAIWSFTTAAGAPSGTIGTTYNFNICSGSFPDGFTQYSVSGAQVWACTTFGRDAANPPAGSAPNGIQINGFAGGTNVLNQDWFISPAYDLTATDFPLLSFWSRTAFNGLPLKLRVSTNYVSGDPNAATWTELNGSFPLQASDYWKLSSNINLSAFKTTNVRIAFVYTSSIDDGARWTLDDISIVNSAVAPPPSLTVSTGSIQFGFVAAAATSTKEFTFTASELTGDVSLSSTGNFQISKDNLTFNQAVTYTQVEANNATKTVYVKFLPDVAGQNFTGSVTVSTAGVADTIISLNGTSIDPVNTLEVVNWNIEWFGSTTLGPSNDAQQEINVRTILQNIGADIYGLAEVVSESRLANIVSQMPGYTYVISDYGSHTNTSVNPASALAEAQKLAFIYNSSIFTNVTAAPLLSQGINTAADIANPAYNYFASGRFPYMMTADVTLNGVTKQIRFILIHGKANTSPTATSYARRKAASDTLHQTLNALYPNDNIVFLGDFNDDLDQSITAGFTVTSYSAFTTDNINFYSPTLPLSLAGKKSTISYNDVIDHVIISNEMQCSYMPQSANILTDVTSLVNNYGSSTTDHYPVFSRYAFTASPSATISYPGSPFCSTSGAVTPAMTGNTGGTFTSLSGLTLNSSTGSIDPATSTPGTYPVTYTLAATACNPAVSVITNVTISAPANATISYGTSPVCLATGTTLPVTFTGTTGGSFTSGSGLVIDAVTGTINTGTSTPGSYTITYTVPASGGCPQYQTTASVVINTASVAPVAAIAATTAFCGSGTTTLSVQGGTLGTGAAWKWYTSCGGGTLIGTGATLTNIAVNGTTTFYVRAEGVCNTTACASVIVNVADQPAISISAAPYSRLLPGMTTVITATVSPASPSNSITWYKNGALISGQGSSAIDVDVDGLGTYYAKVSNSAGCFATSNSISISDSASDKLFITPNPNRGQFQVRYTSERAITQVRSVVIYDSKGARVYSESFITNTGYATMNVDLRGKGKGLFFVIVADKNNNKLAEGKVTIL